MTEIIPQKESEVFKPFQLSNETPLLDTLPVQAQRSARANGIAFTVMAVGESGTGKSTFIRSLFGWGYSGYEKEATNDEPTRRDVHRTTEIEVRHANLDENGFQTRLTVVDTPGFGDYSNNENCWAPVSSFIDAQHRFYMLQEEQPKRNRLEDTRVHLCLYFLPPTGRLLEMDLKAMAELSPRVNLVPIIAKADSLTPQNRTAFKQLIRETLACRKIHVWTPQWPTTDYEWPLAVCTSDEFVTTSDNRTVRGRRYNWGTVEIDNPEHSDFSKLRDLLIGECMLELTDDTHRLRYLPQRRSMRLFRLGAALNLKPDGTYRNQLVPELESGTASIGRPLRPEERPSVSCMMSRMQITKDVTEEAAEGMTGLEMISVISKVGSQFLEAERLEQDTVLRQRAQALRSQFEVVTRYQQERFLAQETELQKRHDEFETEILNSTIQVKQLATEIKLLESKKK